MGDVVHREAACCSAAIPRPVSGQSRTEQSVPELGTFIARHNGSAKKRRPMAAFPVKTRNSLCIRSSSHTQPSPPSWQVKSYPNSIGTENLLQSSRGSLYRASLYTITSPAATAIKDSHGPSLSWLRDVGTMTPELRESLPCAKAFRSSRIAR